MSDKEKKNQNTDEKPEAPAEEKTTESPAQEATPEAQAPEAPVESPEPIQSQKEKKKETDALQEELQKSAEEEVEVKELPHRDIKPGMLIRVHERIVDASPKGEKRERVQVFEGMVMGLKGKGIGRTVTVRKDSKGFMVEKIFPLSSPNIMKIEVKKRYQVRRAKLSYLKGRFKRKLKEITTDSK